MPKINTTSTKIEAFYSFGNSPIIIIRHKYQTLQNFSNYELIINQLQTIS